MISLAVTPLTPEAFAPFGEVLDTRGDPILINAGFARRHNDLCTVDVAPEGGATNVSIFVAKARTLPLLITMMERHPLGSQAFMPLQDQPWLAVVCIDPADPSTFRAFACTGRQGVNYARDVWHFPLVTFADGDRFMVVDRKGPGNNLEERFLPQDRHLTVSR
ncbi:MAG: ureidoglycolate lyase [Proteobacteria bacterium]|nr:ureidoglycolate lyase [Pseudomonadota bacterium]